jgi:hypothetical protein
VPVEYPYRSTISYFADLLRFRGERSFNVDSSLRSRTTFAYCALFSAIYFAYSAAILAE